MSDTREKLSDIMLGMVEDINPAEIANHIARGNLHEWCERWRETVGKYLSSIGNGVTVQEWIPASEPPKDSEPVLVCTKHRRPFKARYLPDRGRWDVSHSVIITHWMPLPEPPKGD